MDRATGASLKKETEEARAAFLFDDLKLENEVMAKELNDDGSDDERNDQGLLISHVGGCFENSSAALYAS